MPKDYTGELKRQLARAEKSEKASWDVVARIFKKGRTEARKEEHLPFWVDQWLGQASLVDFLQQELDNRTNRNGKHTAGAEEEDAP